MKNTIQILCFLLISSFAMAQDGPRENKREKLKAQRIAYLTSELELTPEEATKFWPVYNAYTDKMKTLRKDGREERGKGQRGEKSVEKVELTDAQAYAAIEEMHSNNAKKLEYHRQLTADLRGIISPQKILRLNQVENKFKRKLLGEIGKRRKGNRNRATEE